MDSLWESEQTEKIFLLRDADGLASQSPDV